MWLALRRRSGVARVEVAEVALPVGFLLLVALEAFRLERQEVPCQGLRVPDVLVAGDALDLRLLVALVREEDLVTRGAGPQDGRRGGAGEHAAADQKRAPHRKPPGRPAGMPKR